MTVLDIEKECPVCGEVGNAVADNGEHIGAWRCKNENCPKEFFVDSDVQFYDTESLNWTWDTIDEVAT